VAVDSSDERAAILHMLIFLVLRQQYGHPAGRLFFKAQILMQDAMNGPHANSLGDNKRFGTQAAILFNDGGDRSDESGASLWTVFFPFRWRWSEVVSPALTFFMIA
jgi:hypothetical protein